MEQQKKISLNPHFRNIWNDESRVLILYGSRSSSKSDFIATQIVSNLMTHEYYSLISVRKTYESIYESSFRTLVEKIESLGLANEFTITKSPMKVVCKKNANQVIFRGMDDMGKLKSIKDPSAIHFEEDVPENYEDYLTISLSLRGGKSRYLQEIFTINPVIDNYQEHWFWQRFFSGQTELSFTTEIEDIIDEKTIKQKVTAHHSTWRDNLFLSPQDRLAFKSLEKDPIQYQQQSLGLWANRIVSDQFYKKFSLEKNSVDNIKYRDDLPLHVSFDFNVEPFSACLVFQADGDNAWQIDEICLENPNNSLPDTLKEFKRRYRNHINGLYIYGDCNGFNKDTATEKGVDKYTIICKELSMFHPKMRVPRSNPNISGRGNFINDLFLGEIRDVNFLINRNCNRLMMDLINQREHKDGTKLKQKVLDRRTGKNIERYGHCFAGDTLITTINGDIPIKEINVGDLVLTSNGYRRVLNRFNNGLKEVKEYIIGENILVCTPDHKIWTEELGFVEINTLLYRNSGQEYTIMDKQLCKKKLSIMEVINGAGIQTTSCLHSEIISSRRLRSLREIGKMNAYIDGYGLMRLDQFQMDIISTIWMEILLITSFLIWNVFKLENILNYMDQKVKNVKNFFERFNQKLVSLLKNGTSQRKVENGTKNTCGINYKQLQILENVLNVGRNMKEILYPQIKTTVPNYVPLELVREEIVYGKDLQRVYDLEVEECHEYFANGILVHNCSDAMDYFICQYFSNNLERYKKGHTSKYSTGRVYSTTKHRSSRY